MNDNKHTPSALPTGEELNESVDEILSQIMGDDGELGESFSTLFAKYLGSEHASSPPLMNRDISDRTDEMPKPRQRIEYEDPENIPPPMQNTEKRISEKIPDGMRTVYSAAENEAQKPEFTADGTVKYPILGTGEAEERVVFDADWEENAKKEAARRDAYRREQMLMGDSAYARNAGFVTRGYAKNDYGSAKYGSNYPPKPNVNPAYIDPLSDEEEDRKSDADEYVRQPKTPRNPYDKNDRMRQDYNPRIVYEATDPPPPDDTSQQTERTEDPVNNTSDNNSFFPEGFSAKVNNNAVGGKTEATDNIGETAKKSVVDEAVLDAFAQAEDSENAFRERWKAEVQLAQSRREKNAQLLAEKQRLAEARRLREERLASRRLSGDAGKPMTVTPETSSQKKTLDAEIKKAVAQQTAAEEVKKDIPADDSFSFEPDAFEMPILQPKPIENKNIPRPERLVGEKGNLLRAGTPNEVTIPKNAAQRRHYFMKTQCNADGLSRWLRRSFPNKKDDTAEIVRKSVRLLSLIVLCGALVYLAVYGIKYVKRVTLTHDIDRQINSLDNLTDEQVAEAWKNIHVQYPDVDFPEGMNVKYANLYAINQDVVGYLTIANTNIQTVLLQTDYDDYYLYRDIYKAKSRYGNPFVSRYSQMGKNGLSKNTIIYGHNTHDELMFNQLTRYMTVAGYLNAPIVTMDTLYENTTWKVFAVMLTNSTPSKDNGYVFDYLKTSFSSDSEFMSLVNALYDRSMIHTGVDVVAGDKIMMLYTCYQNIFEGGRLVVCARQLRDGEAPQIDTSKVYYNSSARFPQAYYDEKGLVNPYYSGSQINATDNNTSSENNTQSPSVNETPDATTQPSDADEGEITSAAPENTSSEPTEASTQPPPGEQPSQTAEDDTSVSVVG